MIAHLGLQGWRPPGYAAGTGTYDPMALSARGVQSGRGGMLRRIFDRDEIRGLVAEAFAVEEHGFDIWSGVAGAIATAGPVALGVATGDRAGGLIAGIGGLNTALCVPRAGLRSRLWWGTVGAVGGCGAALLATLAAPHAWLLALIGIVWVGLWALLRAAGPTGSLTGFATGAVFVVIGGFPPHAEALGTRELLFTAGAFAGLALMVVARRGPQAPVPVARGTVTAVRDAVRHDSTLRAHAVRLSLAVALATLIERGLGLPHGYWVPLTVLAIVQPAAHATEVRSLQRAAGTLVGVVVIIAITAVTGEVWALVACTAIASLGLFTLDERGYFWLVVMLTPTALLLLSIATFQGFLVGVERTLNSALGILIGLIIADVAQRIGRPSKPTPTRSEAPGGDQPT
jgi:hypothetical protein